MYLYVATFITLLKKFCCVIICCCFDEGDFSVVPKGTSCVRLITMCRIKVSICENFSDALSTRNGLTQEESSLPLLRVKFVMPYCEPSIKNHKGLTLNSIYNRLLVYADAFNMLSGKVKNLKNNTKLSVFINESEN
jgi:hypothetical protein